MRQTFIIGQFQGLLLPVRQVGKGLRDRSPQFPVGLRLKRLADGSSGNGAQVLVVTHSAQVAARADAHWRIAKSGDETSTRTRVEPLSPAERQEEIARMLSGAEVTEAARAAARALIG